jgi:peptide/nickel transport system ATP-binding protein
VSDAGPVFSVRGLSVAFSDGDHRRMVLRNVDLDARPGRVTGVVGESGSGKTTAVLAAIGIAPPGATVLAGESVLAGRSLIGLSHDELRALWRSEVSYVSQDAAGSLNPAYRVGTQFAEVLRTGSGIGRGAARARAVELLEAVRMPDPDGALDKYPHQFSGGQLQRIAIALGLACEPRLLVLDEPTTGLDVTTEAEVIAMLAELIRARDVATVFISHNLGLIGTLADDVSVLYAGEIVEAGPVAPLMAEPRHPYTRALLDCVLSPVRAIRPTVLPGSIPLEAIDHACSFAPRCAHRREICGAAKPPLEDDGAGRLVRCVRAHEIRPLVTAASTDVEAPGHDRPTEVLRLAAVTCAYGRGRGGTRVVHDVDLRIGVGEVVGLVGESGSGKTTIGRAVAGIIEPRSGALYWEGQPLAWSGAQRPASRRREIQIIFQNANSSLNPRHTVGSILNRSLQLFRPDVSSRDARTAAIEAALGEVRLDPSLASRYPHQLSGGQKQRVAIARAFVARPKLVICDEIVSSQDVSVQAALLELLRGMRERHGTSLLFVSHDLGVIRSIADHAYILESGRVVEHGPTADLFENPVQPYTKRLLDAASSHVHA